MVKYNRNKSKGCRVYGYWSTTIYLFSSSRFTGCDLYVVHFLIEKYSYLK